LTALVVDGGYCIPWQRRVVPLLRNGFFTFSLSDLLGRFNQDEKLGSGAFSSLASLSA
jgi:hypothetical protein